MIPPLSSTCSVTNRRLQSLHNDLLRTAGSTRLSPTHGAAALNSLCGFLDLCSECADPEVSTLPFSFHSWITAFQVFLARNENTKAKPVRRLLLTLTSLISRHPVDDVKLALIAHVIHVATQVICGQDEVGSIKAAIQVLEHFLSTRIVDALDVVHEISPRQLKSARTSLTARVVDDTPEFVNIVQSFTSSVLQWVQYPDCAPAVGRFLSAFFASLGISRSQEVAHASADWSLPLWISPVKQSLNRRNNLLDVYENHVLPGLLRLSSADRKAFLSTLPLDQTHQGNSGELSTTDIQLCILVAKIDLVTKLDPAPQSAVGKPKITNNGDCLQPGIESSDADKDRVDIDGERLGLNLLAHSSPAVRISALALLVSSPVSTRALSEEALLCLRRCIPFFHVEVSAKTRNEFISLMNKLCLRLRIKVVSLIRDHLGSINAYLDQTAGLSLGHASSKEQRGKTFPKELQRYLSFQSGYMRFLVHELRPAASYQSHISALRILHSVLESKLLSPALKANELYVKLSEEGLPSSLLLRPLLDLLLDPFDDVRQVANMVIKVQISLGQILFLPKLNGEGDAEAVSLEKGGSSCNSNQVLHVALERAESKAAETGRADHADGVGRIHDLMYGTDEAVSIVGHLLDQLKDEVEVAKSSLISAVNTAPLHGHLIALR
jgi:hypothetical protein